MPFGKVITFEEINIELICYHMNMIYLKNKKVLRIFIPLILCLILIDFSKASAQSQKDTSTVYKINPWITGGIGIGGLIISQEMLKYLSDEDEISQTTLNSLDKNDINSFDRRAVEQTNYQYANEAHKISNYWLMGSFLLPITLFIDKKIRNDWLRISLLYLETQAISSNMYIWLGPMAFERHRPVTYYSDDQVGLNSKTPGRNKHSFFSGHTSNTATGTFFFAKVLTDYHPEWNGKWKIWAAASIPPVMVGYLRYRALKHFPTDILIGFIVGGGSGILVPHLHKRKNKNLKMSLYWEEDNVGFNARWTLK